MTTGLCQESASITLAFTRRGRDPVPAKFSGRFFANSSLGTPIISDGESSRRCRAPSRGEKGIPTSVATGAMRTTLIAGSPDVWGSDRAPELSKDIFR